ncbi:autotransporter outer membrane beta-barrel domain-containing protein [Brucellaceae bacterium D45D]
MKKVSSIKMSANLRSSTSILSLGLLTSAIVTLVPQVGWAACAVTGTTTSCSVSAPNPWGASVGGGKDANGATVILDAGARIETSQTNGISIGSNGTITLGDNSHVVNSFSAGGQGSWGSGPNTVEFGSDVTLTVGQGASIVAIGSGANGEAINVHGTGTTIINHGLIQGEQTAAIWYENWEQGSTNDNTIDNYGIIERLDGGSVVGTGGGNLNFTNRTNAEIRGNLSFGGGNDVLTLEPDSVVTGDIDGGGGANHLVLQGEAGSSDELAGALKNFTTLTKSGTGLWTITGSLTGFNLVEVKNGTLALSGDNVDYNGTVTVDANGILEARAQSLPVKSVAADNIGNVQNNGLVRFNQPDDGNYIGQIVGTGAVEKSGNGVLTLSPAVTGGNTYSGGTRINGGTIAIAADSALGATSGALTLNGGALRFDSSFDLANSRAITLAANGGTFDTNGNASSIQQAISGAGSLTKAGAGTLNLEGANSYSGSTTVNAGALYINGNQSAARGLTSVQSGATIGGIGTIGGNLNIANGGILAPGKEGQAPGKLSVAGNLQLGANSILNYSFGQANVVGGPLNDLTAVKGNLTLDGTLNVITPPNGTFAPGVYRIISYEGSLTNNGLDVGTTPASNYYVQTIVDKQVNLVNTSGLTLNFWDVWPASDGAIGNGTIQGGSGIWQNSAPSDANINWTNADGTLHAPYQDAAFDIFMGNAGTVTVKTDQGDVRSAGMQFFTDGYIVEGDAITLVGNEAIVSVGDGTADGADSIATINSELTGAARLVKNDLGTLVLTGENTYTGGTSFNGGVVEIADNLNLGDAAGELSFDAGTLRTTADIAIDRATTLEGAGGVIETADDTSLDYAGEIAGDGGLTKTGSGELLINAHNSYSGATLLEAGTLRANGADYLSNASDYAVNSGAQLVLDGHDQTINGLSNAGSVKFGTTAGTVLTVTGNYVGDGGTLEINTVLGDDNSVTDRLVVEGDTSGTSSLRVANDGGAGAQTVEGIKVIDVAGNSEGTFNLLGNYEHNGEQAVVVGAYAYKLRKNGVSTPEDGDWYLRSEIKDPKPDPVEPENPVTPEPQPEPQPEAPLYQAGVPTYESYAQSLLGLNGVSTLQQRVGNRLWAGNGNRVIAQGADPVGTPYAASEEAGVAIEGNGVWGRIEGAHNKIEPRFSTSSTDYDQNILKLQAGLDGLLLENEGGKLIGGVTVHYAHGKTETQSVHGDGEIATDGYGFGGTLTWYGENGFYLDGQAQVTWYDSDLSSTLANTTLADGNDGFGYALSVEGGKRIAIDQAWSLTPQAQLVYSSVDFDDFTDTFGSRISLDRGDSLQGRLGLTLDHENSWQNANGQLDRAHVYGIANLYYEFLEGTKVDVAGVSFASEQDRLWGGLGIGGSYNWNDDKYSIYGEGLVNTSLNNFGDSYSVKGQAGFRVKW